jgi:hypothetical protein
VSSTVDISAAITDNDQRRALQAGADRLLKGARDRAPKLTGQLAASGSTTVLSPNLAAVVFDKAYAHYQETSRLKHPRGGRRHFLQDASEQDLQRVIDVMAAELFR